MYPSHVIEELVHTVFDPSRSRRTHEIDQTFFSGPPDTRISVTRGCKCRTVIRSQYLSSVTQVEIHKEWRGLCVLFHSILNYRVIFPTNKPQKRCISFKSSLERPLLTNSQASSLVLFTVNRNEKLRCRSASRWTTRGFPFCYRAHHLSNLAYRQDSQKQHSIDEV